VLQETFLYFLRKFPGFRLTANLKTFLYPAVRHLSIAARRKAARYQTTPWLTIQGQVGSTNQIEYSTDLSQTNWTVLTNLVVTASPYWFFDVGATAQGVAQPALPQRPRQDRASLGDGTIAQAPAE
jgi:DNA-directed RNA polymerase specialized sigma24 family protein